MAIIAPGLPRSRNTSNVIPLLAGKVDRNPCWCPVCAAAGEERSLLDGARLAVGYPTKPHRLHRSVARRFGAITSTSTTTSAGGRPAVSANTGDALRSCDRSSGRHGPGPGAQLGQSAVDHRALTPPGPGRPVRGVHVAADVRFRPFHLYQAD